MRQYFEKRTQPNNAAQTHEQPSITLSNESSSPKEMNLLNKEYSSHSEISKPARKSSANRELKHSQKELPESPRRETRLSAKEHSSSDPLDTMTSPKISRNISPQRESKLFTKEQNSSDPSDSTPSTLKLPRNISPYRESRLSGKEPSSSDSLDPMTSPKISRNISPRRDLKKHEKEYASSGHLDTTHTSKTSWHSPLSGLRKSNRGDDKFFKDSALDKKPADSTVNSSKITTHQKNYSSSSEQENEPKALYPLNLSVMISRENDPISHGKIGAYSDKNLQKADTEKSTHLECFTFIKYFFLITNDLNELQRKKYTIIESLVAILAPAYANELRSETNHKNFCRELLEVILCCMGTTNKACEKSNYLPESKLTYEKKIAIFWHGAALGVILLEEHRKNYDKLIIELHEIIEESFVIAIKLSNVKEQIMSSSVDDNLPCCITWDYLCVLANANVISDTNFNIFKTFYNETSGNYPGEFIFVPHMWGFIRDNLDKEPKHHSSSQHSPHYQTLKDLDELFLKTKIFTRLEPGTKNQSTLRSIFNI